jgi:hypothetical protein
VERRQPLGRASIPAIHYALFEDDALPNEINTLHNTRYRSDIRYFRYSFMKVTQRILIILAAVIWYGGGVSLLFKGGSLIRNAYALDPQSIWIYLAPILGITIGLLKGRFLFRKNCERNLKRIKTLASPHIGQCFAPGMLIFLAIIIPTGAWMSRAAAGNFTLLCLVGALDLSIACALLSSSVVFWKHA